MITLYIIFGFIFGSIIGSFLNVVIYRLYKEKSLGGFSACPACKHKLAALDLIPIFSFFLLAGKCRYCKSKISWQYPLVELITGILFSLIVFQAVSGTLLSLNVIFELVFVSILVVIFTFDLIYYLIPDEMVLIGAGLAIVYRLIVYDMSLVDGFWGALAVGGFFAILFFASGGRWIGFGDVKLGIFLGLLLGLAPSLTMLMLAYVSGAIVGVVMVAAKKRTMKGILPFGTFLTAATVVILLFGGTIQSWYSNFLLL